ncbi:unnamed protein product [Calypogeia fissa]
MECNLHVSFGCRPPSRDASAQDRTVTINPQSKGIRVRVILKENNNLPKVIHDKLGLPSSRVVRSSWFLLYSTPAIIQHDPPPG